MPMVVLNDSLISHVNGVFNAVMVWGDGVDKTMFYGRGAGKLPTASAVLGDIIDAVKSNGTVDSQSWEAVEDNSFVAGMDEFKAPRMYRLENISEDSVIKTAESVGISVISQTNSGCLVSSCDEDKAKEFADKLESIGIIVKAQIPVLEDN